MLVFFFISGPSREFPGKLSIESLAKRLIFGVSFAGETPVRNELEVPGGVGGGVWVVVEILDGDGHFFLIEGYLRIPSGLRVTGLQRKSEDALENGEIMNTL